MASDFQIISLTLAAGLIIGVLAKPLMGGYGPGGAWCALLGMVACGLGGLLHQFMGGSAIGVVAGSFLYQFAGVKFDSPAVRIVCAAAFSGFVMIMTGVLALYHSEQ